MCTGLAFGIPCIFGQLLFECILCQKTGNLNLIFACLCTARFSEPLKRSKTMTLTKMEAEMIGLHVAFVWVQDWCRVDVRAISSPESCGLKFAVASSVGFLHHVPKQSANSCARQRCHYAKLWPSHGALCCLKRNYLVENWCRSLTSRTAQLRVPPTCTECLPQPEYSGCFRLHRFCNGSEEKDCGFPRVCNR